MYVSKESRTGICCKQGAEILHKITFANQNYVSLGLNQAQQGCNFLSLIIPTYGAGARVGAGVGPPNIEIQR